MARKKEPGLAQKNQSRILEVAKELFLRDGIEKTKMDTIAKQAQMSKSTLYVYFKTKEEIINYISLEAMTFFYEELRKHTTQTTSSFYERYMAVCNTLVEFKDTYPLNFELIVKEIAVDEITLSENPVLAQIYDVGEKINKIIINILTDNGQMMDVQKAIAKIFAHWGCLYGLLMLADNKKAYILKDMGLTRNEFLQQGFEQLYTVWTATGTN